MEEVTFRVLLTFLLLHFASFIGRAAHAAPALKTRARLSVPDARLNESSGLVASRRYKGSLWTHNDSGDSARVFLLAPTGTVQAEVRLSNAGARDWEDISFASGYVYCADIGDNNRVRPNVQIYRFPEPRLPLDGRAVTLPAESVTLRYPDGAHDAETLLARRDGSLLIVTKDVGGSGVYVSPPFRAGATQTLRKIGAFTLPPDDGDLLSGFRGTLATAGSVSPDGQRITVTSYTHLYEWTLPKGANAWSRVWKTTPRAYKLPVLRQIEAVAYALDGKSWWLTSEKSPMPFLRLSR